MGSQKAQVAGLAAPAVVVIMYLLGEIDFVARMPEEVRVAVGTLVLGGLSVLAGYLVWLVPNAPKEG